jgi:hypothetical protein
MSVVSLAQGTSSDWLTKELKASVEARVFNKEFGSEGLESLSQVLCELGASSKGYLGVLLCPYGTEKVPGKSRHVLYKRTIAVWVLQDPNRPGKHQFLRTGEFARWVRNNVLHNSGIQSGSSFGRTLRQYPASLSPRDSVSQVGARVIPPPSAVGANTSRFRSALSHISEGGSRVIPAPSAVNTITGDHSSYEDKLNLCEAEFVDCPRIVNDQGLPGFDPVEFERRADALDAARALRGLRPIGLTTPSTYHR